jgi:hypothetical protein
VKIVGELREKGEIFSSIPAHIMHQNKKSPELLTGIFFNMD